jgi:hypothetical protein
MMPRLLLCAFAGWVFVTPIATAISEPEPIRVAVGVIETDSAEITTISSVENLQALLITGLSKETGVEVLGRDNMEEAMKELGLQVAGHLASNAGIAMGRWLNAGILIAGTEVWNGERRSRIDFEFIDLFNGDVLARHPVPFSADEGKELRLDDRDVETLQKDLATSLRQAAELQRQLKGRTRIAPLFFFNDEPGLHDLDLVEEAFQRAAEAQNRASNRVRYILFPRAMDAAKERALRLDGLALPRGDGLAEIADGYVWGYFHELPSSEVPFPDVQIAVTLHLWRPSGELTILRETISVGIMQDRLDAMLERVTALALDPKAAGTETEKMVLSAEELAIEMFRMGRLKSEVLLPSMLKFQRTESDLYRWGGIRQIAATAHFFDPGNWLIAREAVTEQHNNYFRFGSGTMKPHPRDSQRRKKQDLQATMDFLHFIRRYGPHPLSTEGKIHTRENKDFIRLVPGETLRDGELEVFQAGKDIGILVPYVRPANLRNRLGDNRLPHGPLFARFHKRLLEYVLALPEPFRATHLAEWQKQLVSDFALVAAALKKDVSRMTILEWQWLAQEIPDIARHLPVADQREAIELWLPLFVTKEQEISPYKIKEWRSLIERAYAESADPSEPTRWLAQAEKMQPKPISTQEEVHGHPPVPRTPAPAKPTALNLPRLATQPEKVIDLNYDDAGKIYKKDYPEMLRRMSRIVDIDSHGVRAMVCAPGHLYFTTDSDNLFTSGAPPGIWSWRFEADTPDFLSLDLGIKSRIKTLLLAGSSWWLFSEGTGVYSLDRAVRFTQKDGLPTETIFAAAVTGDRIYIGGGEDESAARFGYYSLTGKQWTAVAPSPMKKGKLPRIMELATSGAYVAARGPVSESFLHVLDTERKTWSDLWPAMARYLGDSGEPWELPAWRAEARFSALCGESGGFWVGTPRGLFHFDPRSQQFRKFELPGALRPDKIVTTERLVVIAASQTGEKSSELLFLNKATGKWIGSIPLEKVTALAIGEGFVWIGTDQGSAAKGARIFRILLTAIPGSDLRE